MNNILFGFLSFFIIFQANAQKYELGKVTVEELNQKKHAADSSAVAALLFKKSNTYFTYSGENGFVSYTEVEQKIKVYKKEGFDWADIEIPYYVGYENIKDDNVEILSAFTYNLVNNKVEREKVTKQGKFEHHLNEFWSKKTISFPNVKVGSIIEIKYKLKTGNLSNLPEFQFQYNIPVNYAELQTEIPEFYIYKGMLTGFEKLTTTQKMNRKISSFTSKLNQSLQIAYKEIVTNYVAQNIKAVVDEKHVNNIENYYGKIQHELQTIRMPKEEPKQIAKTWEDVARTIYEDKDFGGELRQFEYFASDVKSLIKNVASEDEKLKIIFKFVQQRMNWNKQYGYYAKKRLEIAYQERTGNVAEINLMLTSILRMAGFKANPVLISTRENGIAFFPNKTLFNYVICAVKLNEETILLDATEKYTDINFLPIRALNWSGRSVEANNVCEEVDLMPKNNSLDSVNLMIEIDPNGEIKGKVREQYFDYNALIFRSKFGKVDSESRVENIEKNYSGLEISNFELLNVNDVTKPIIENYSFTTSNEMEIIGEKMYFSPLLYFAYTENPFKQENRLYPIDFVFPHQDKFNITIKIPEGYTIETAPQAISIALPEKLGSYKFAISNNGNQIQLLCTLEFNASSISADYYQDLKLFFKQIVDKQTEKIVLKKIKP
ncbi:DUF3857 domain-containing protein [Flavobacterium sp.]